MGRLKGLETSVLLDFYGGLLTEKQREVLDMYYNLDYSLGEIAENLGVTRQGVLDTIKRGQARLNELESCLCIKRRFDTVEHNILRLETALLKCDEPLKSEVLSIIRDLRAAWED